MENALSNKFGNVEFLNEDSNYLFFKSEEFDIRVTKETSHDRHKVEIKDQYDKDYGFISTLGTWEVK
jgi:hypothetical protein